MGEKEVFLMAKRVTRSVDNKGGGGYLLRGI